MFAQWTSCSVKRTILQIGGSAIFVLFCKCQNKPICNLSTYRSIGGSNSWQNAFLICFGSVSEPPKVWGWSPTIVQLFYFTAGTLVCFAERLKTRCSIFDHAYGDRTPNGPFSHFRTLLSPVSTNTSEQAEISPTVIGGGRCKGTHLLNDRQWVQSQILFRGPEGITH